MLKSYALAAMIAAAPLAPAAAAVTFNLGGTASTGTAYSYTVDGQTLAVTGATYGVAPIHLTTLSQLTSGATVTRATTGLGIASAGEDGGETPQVDADGSPNEILRFALAGKSQLVSATFDWVDDNDSLRVYGANSGVMTLLGFPGEFWDNTPTDAAMGGGVTVTHAGTGSLNNNWVFTVAFPTMAYYDAYYFTSNADSADGYQIRSLTLATPPLTPRDQTGAVPEAASWMMMVLGFGALGAMLRRPRTTLAFG